MFRGMHAVLSVVAVERSPPEVLVCPLVTPVLAVTVPCLFQHSGDGPWLVVAVKRLPPACVDTVAVEAVVEQDSLELAAEEANYLQ